MTRAHPAPGGGCGCAACCGSGGAAPAAPRVVPPARSTLAVPRGLGVAARSGVLFGAGFSAPPPRMEAPAAPPPPGRRPFPRGEGTFLGQEITEQLAFDLVNAAYEAGCEDRVALAGGAVSLDTVTRDPPGEELLIPRWDDGVRADVSTPVDGLIWVLVGDSADFTVFVLSDSVGIGRPHWCNQRRGTGELAKIGVVSRMDGGIEVGFAPTAMWTTLSLRVRLESRCYGDVSSGATLSVGAGTRSRAEGAVAVRLQPSQFSGVGRAELAATVLISVEVTSGGRLRRYADHQSYETTQDSACLAVGAWFAGMSRIVAEVLGLGMEGINVWRSTTRIPGPLGGVQDVRGVCSPVYLSRLAVSHGEDELPLVAEPARSTLVNECLAYFGTGGEVGFHPPDEPPTVKRGGV